MQPCPDCSTGHYLQGREEAREGEDEFKARAEAAEQRIKELEAVAALLDERGVFRLGRRYSDCLNERDQAEERAEGLEAVVREAAKALNYAHVYLPPAELHDRKRLKGNVYPIIDPILSRERAAAIADRCRAALSPAPEEGEKQ